MNTRYEDETVLLSKLYEYAVQLDEPIAFQETVRQLETQCTPAMRAEVARQCATWITAQAEITVQAALLKGLLYHEIAKQPSTPCRGKSLARAVHQQLLLQHNETLTVAALSTPADCLNIQIPLCIRIAFQAVRYDQATKLYHLELVRASFPLHAERQIIAQLLLAEIKYFVTATMAEHHADVRNRMNYNTQDAIFSTLCKHTEKVLYGIEEVAIQSFEAACMGLHDKAASENFLPVLGCPYRVADLELRLEQQAQYFADLFLYHAVTGHVDAMRQFFYGHLHARVFDPQGVNTYGTASVAAMHWQAARGERTRGEDPDEKLPDTDPRIERNLDPERLAHQETSRILYRDILLLLHLPDDILTEELSIETKQTLKNALQGIWHTILSTVQVNLQNMSTERLVGAAALQQMSHDHVELLRLCWQPHVAQYVEMIDTASTLRSLIHSLYITLYPVCLLEVACPELSTTHELFYDDSVRVQFDDRNYAIGHAVDAAGDTLLHHALRQYAQLPSIMRRRVQLLCLFSHPDACNQAGETPQMYVTEKTPDYTVLMDLLDQSRQQGVRFYEARKRILNIRNALRAGETGVDLVAETKRLMPVEQYLATHRVYRWLPRIVHNPKRIDEAWAYLKALEQGRVERMMGLDDVLAVFDAIRAGAEWGFFKQWGSWLHQGVFDYSSPFRESDERCVQAGKPSLNRGDWIVERRRQSAGERHAQERAEANFRDKEEAEARARAAEARAEASNQRAEVAEQKVEIAEQKAAVSDRKAAQLADENARLLARLALLEQQQHNSAPQSDSPRFFG